MRSLGCIVLFSYFANRRQVYIYKEEHLSFSFFCVVVYSIFTQTFPSGVKGKDMCRSSSWEYAVQDMFTPYSAESTAGREKRKKKLE
jgi:hypothetical protein